jgi:hypothetical protein
VNTNGVATLSGNSSTTSSDSIDATADTLPGCASTTKTSSFLRRRRRGARQIVAIRHGRGDFDAAAGLREVSVERGVAAKTTIYEDQARLVHDLYPAAHYSEVGFRVLESSAFSSLRISLGF